MAGEKRQTSRREAASTPEQSLGDSPIPPWEMPSPEEKRAAAPVKAALKKALAEVVSEQKAEQVAEQIYAATAGMPASEVAQNGEARGKDVRQAAKAVQHKARAAAPGDKAAQVLTEAARQVLETEGRDREALAQAAQEVLNPEQQGVRGAPDDRRRDLLRRAILRRMGPLDAVDAQLFLMVNHLPHSRATNRFFYLLTLAFNAGLAWYVLLALASLRRPRPGLAAARATVLPLALSTAIVEYPIKAYFRRRRPFITVVQAIVVGMKPGTWSFPSGHSASAFAGAWLLHRQYPRLGPLVYAVAGTVAFSRVYLGDHYPGDVVSGSLAGMGLANGLSWLQSAVGRLFRSR